MLAAPAFGRAVTVCALGLVAAALVHRADLLVLVTPFVVWLAWAAITRPRITDARAEFATPHVQLREGESVRMALTAPPGATVTAVLDPPPQSRLTPRHGAVSAVTGSPAADDDLAIGFEPEVFGRYNIGPARVVVSDPSGAWRSESTTSPATARVRPQGGVLEGGSGVAHPIGIAGVHRSLQRGGGTDIAEVREFAPGDRLRRVNWKVSTRTGRLHVTDTFVERDTDVLLVVDTLAVVGGAPLPHGEAEPSSLDAVVRAVAAIAQHYVAFGDRIALHDLGRRIGPVPAGSGPRQTRVLLDRLAEVRRDLRAEVDVVPVQRFTSGTLVFVCSPLLADPVVSEVVRLRRLGGEVVVVDTMPALLGRQPLPGRDPERLSEGWTLVRMQQERTVELLRGIGVPVTPWRGPGSLASVLTAMQAARSAPRLRGGAR